MKILRGLAHLKEEIPHPILTIGNFDGVHLGHRAIFQQVIQRAQAIGGTSVVLTFEPHPLRVLRPDQAPPVITTLEEKMRLLDALGIQVAIHLPFTPELSAMSAQQFVEEILWQRIGIRELYVGYDFGFGRGRTGTIASLREMGTHLGFEVKKVGPVFIDDQVVSSSLIRRLIQQGEVQRATFLLGRPYALTGTLKPIERTSSHTSIVSLYGQTLAHHSSPEWAIACRESLWMADRPQCLDPEMEAKGLSAARLFPQKELLPPPGLYAVQILHRPGISPVEDDLAHLCHIPSPQDHCPPWLDLWEVPGEIVGENWEIAFLYRLSHWDEGVAMGWTEVEGKGVEERI